ncbi:chromosome segregation protein SMC [Ructibacterium gallinarum]|uniref:Chromosome partition protein Smc n=1 Tax=Ructibacterium gallinarum TaxID=2779355 RepID=A0A9D5LWC6_9FIRM|nr:chromosome segregation protein SMC [Ructibacterium gallinarum]MBE5038881.1 chromosome segregation protein SMC [Ructibacterium gallinarum]
MRLKSIEMQGFKSFADKIYLDFNPGITAIVGPNGSGKSNISDAIRWVMGEQSIKSLRGSKMEDVIFSGTEARKALGFAEVTLVLDNSDQYFSLDFPEITVTRRVYRSGEGEYYINKTLCRLKDIHELFMDTGLGRDGYSIIGQGKIDSILSTKSEDRRQIFEEAAGISKYKYRKIEAERKLVQTTDNLTRVEDILGELESQLGPLERQSEKARKYLRLRDEMKDLDIAVSVIQAENAKGQQAELKENIGLLSEQIQKIQKELDDTDAEISQMYEEIDRYDREMENCREADKLSVTAVNEQKNQTNLLLSDIEHNKQNMERMEEEIHSSGEEIERINQTLKEHMERLEQLRFDNQGTTQSLEALTQESQKTGQDVSERSQMLDNIRAEVIALTAEINTLKAADNNLEILEGNYRSRQNIVEQELSGKQQDKSGMLEQIRDKEKIYQEIAEKIARSQDKIRRLNEKYNAGKVRQRELSERGNRNVIQLNQRQSRRSMLLDMEREFEGYARGVKGVMTAYRKGEISGAEIYGPLAQLIKTDQKYVTAIETALGAANQNIVTAAEEDAKAAISYLKEKRLGRATFLPVSAIKGKKFDRSQAEKMPGFVAMASELVQCEETYKNIVQSFLGATVICDTLDHAVVMAKKTGHRFRIVTIEGDVIQAGGAMTGGSAGKTTGSLSRTGEIERLGEEIAKLQKQVTEEKKEREELERLMQEQQEELRKENLQQQQYQQEMVRLQSDLQHQQVLIENTESTAKQLEKENTDIIEKLKELSGRKEANQAQIAAHAEKVRSMEEQVTAVQKEYTELSGKNDVLSSKLTELNIARNTILKDMELQNDRISRLNTEKAQHAQAIAVKNSDIASLRKRNDEILVQIQNLKQSMSEQQKALSQYRNQQTELAQKRGALEEKLRKRQASVKDVQEQMFRLNQQQDRMETRVQRYETEIETIVNRLLEEYDMPYSQAAAVKVEEPFDFKEASARIKSLREQIRALGNINIDAIEEYKNVKERFDFLTVQTNDLEKAKKELETVISDMLVIMQDQFAAQFKLMNENFSRVFSALFGGGRANLILTEPDHVLESGIEIEAQPPGKKLQSLTLLSGGERAFTAIALLFAILEIRPTPFCILDEIEAALDDVNVYRFADYLKHYSDKTQFIVVTHRRGTMEAANILYGVTMQERGISKLLSLNIDEIQQ